MSYLFQGGGDNLTGDLGSGYGASGMTLGIFIKASDHPYLVEDYSLLAMRAVAANLNDTYRLVANQNVDNSWYAQSRNSAGTNHSSARTTNIDPGTIGTTYNASSGWVAMVGTFAASDADRLIRVGTYSTAGSASTTEILVSDALQYIRVGGNAGSATIDVRIAEVAIWNAVLSQTDIESYMGGTSADQVDAANLIWYGSLASDSSKTGGTNSLASLTVSGAAYDSDNPTITRASTNKGRMLLLGVG